MDRILSSPGMMAAFSFVVIVQVLSLLLVWVNMSLFRLQERKYRSLMKQFGSEEAWGNPGRILLPLYLLMTIGVSLAIVFLFIFQPHVL